jgi:hypothetical protein
MVLLSPALLLLALPLLLDLIVMLGVKVLVKIFCKYPASTLLL